SPDGTSIVSQGDPGHVFNGEITVWASATGKQVARFGVKGTFTSLAFSPSGRTLAAVQLAQEGFDARRDRPVPDEKVTGTLHLLEVFSGQEIRRLDMPQGSVWALAFAPDGRTLATGGGDSTILLWDMTARARGGKLKPVPLTAADLDRLWSDLAGDAPTASR